ncbi:MAG: type I pullulanase [Beggiatoa sp. IS2]|nr:MAG: type I pullulanase [Beggiatoa sp. IS2]
MKIELISALMDDYDKVSVYFSTPIDVGISHKTAFFMGTERTDYSVQSVNYNKLVILTPSLDIKKLYRVSYEGQQVEVVPYHVLDRPEFHYHGEDLGLTYTREKSTFKVFAPTATKVLVNLYDSLTATDKRIFTLTEGRHGVWEIIIDQDLKGQCYSFSVDGAVSMLTEHREMLDPYAKCVIGKTRRALIIDLQEYGETVPSPPIALQDLILYEVHIRDVSIDKSAGCQHNGQYLALTEENTYLPRNSQIKTLLGHFRELGVTALQIMPVQDFDNDEDNPDGYAWGYMPRFFDTPDGAYSSNWQTDARIRELKALVNCLHKNHLKVILDVVYNHTAEGIWGEGILSFNGFVPYYYYRFLNGYLSNGSGCGNELRTEAFMVRKFIIDSLKFWTTFYGFDGYRIDLMGLIDIDTLRKMVADLRKVKPDIVVYGEPWTGGTTPIHTTSKGMQRHQGFAVFNDEFRDAIKGHVFSRNGLGYVQTQGSWHWDNVIQGILGSINSFAASPLESINYVEVHDNHTLFDKLYFSLSERPEFVYPDGELLEGIIALHKLSAFILLMSQGIPILQIGQDFLRTKFGVENSYDSGDRINKVDWQRKQDYYSTFVYYQHLIEIRKNHPLLRLTSDTAVREAIDFGWECFPADYPHGISFMLNGGKKVGDSVEKLLIFINPYGDYVKISLNETGWKKLLVGDDYFAEKPPVVLNFLTLPPFSGNVLCK